MNNIFFAFEMPLAVGINEYCFNQIHKTPQTQTVWKLFEPVLYSTVEMKRNFYMSN